MTGTKRVENVEGLRMSLNGSYGTKLARCFASRANTGGPGTGLGSCSSRTGVEKTLAELANRFSN